MSIYLDNGATSFPKAPGVGEAMLDYVNNIGANVNRSTYEASSEAEMVLIECRERLARSLEQRTSPTRCSPPA